MQVECIECHIAIPLLDHPELNSLQCEDSRIELEAMNLSRQNISRWTP